LTDDDGRAQTLDLPPQKADRNRPTDHRRIVNGILWVHQTGAMAGIPRTLRNQSDYLQPVSTPVKPAFWQRSGQEADCSKPMQSEDKTGKCILWMNDPATPASAAGGNPWPGALGWH